MTKSVKNWRKKFQKTGDSLLKGAAVFVILFYRSFIRGLLGAGGFCRFYPSCGDYALQAYRQKSFFPATRLVLRRLLSCHPFAGLFSFRNRRRREISPSPCKTVTPRRNRGLL